MGEIADILADRDVVSSATLFEVRATLGGNRGDLKPGAYELRKDMTYGDAIDRLVAGPSREIIQLTIPEGLSRREIAPRRRARRRARRLPAGERRHVADRRARLRAAAATPKASRASCSPPPTSCAAEPRRQTLVRRQLAAFATTSRRSTASYARRKNLTAFDVVTIASMVEREAQQPRERKLVAAVIYNRLKQGIPLGIDATIRYATGNWQQPLTAEPAGDRLALQHAHQRRPAARADRQPGPRLAAGGGATRRASATSTTW